MRRETKFNYGLLLLGAAMPPIIDAIFGRGWALLLALVLISCVGLLFLVSGHFHAEDGEAQTRRKRYAKFAFVGIVIALAVIGARWAVGKNGSHAGQAEVRETPPSRYSRIETVEFEASKNGGEDFEGVLDLDDVGRLVPWGAASDTVIPMVLQPKPSASAPLRIPRPVPGENYPIGGGLSVQHGPGVTSSQIIIGGTASYDFNRISSPSHLIKVAKRQFRVTLLEVSDQSTKSQTRIVYTFEIVEQ